MPYLCSERIIEKCYNYRKTNFMRQKYRGFVIAVCLFFMIGLLSCNQKSISAISNNEVETIKVNLDSKGIEHPFNTPEHFRISLKDYIGNLELIPLETNSESIISDVSKVLCYDNSYIISDRQSGKILQFDDKGRFMRSFGKKGRGPLEYIDNRDVEINHKTGELGVLSITNPLTILNYSISGDNAYSKVYENIKGYRFYHLSDSIVLVYYTGNYEQDFTLIVSDKLGQVKASYFPNPHSSQYSSIPDQTFHVYDDLVLFNRERSNVIYQIEENGHISERYHIDFGKYNMPDNIKELFYTDFHEYRERAKNYVAGVDQFLESEDHIYFSFGFHQYSVSAFYSKDSQILKLGYSTRGWLDGMLISPTTIIGNEFITILDAYEVFEIADYIEDKTSPAWIEFLEENPMFSKLYNNLKEDSNPVLVKFNLNHF